MPNKRSLIPQIEPWIDLSDVYHVARSVLTTYVTENEYTKRFEAQIRSLTQSRHAIAYNNGTSALYAIVTALCLSPGDEIIVPDITFISSATSIIWAGVTVVLAPIDYNTLQLDCTILPSLVSSRTKALLSVPLYGYSPDYDYLQNFCSEHNIILLEDAAQGVGVKYRDSHVGSIGHAGFLSFYGNKTITTGQGACILTNDNQLKSFLTIFKNHGREHKGTFIHDSEGYNFSFTDMQAALGCSQLQKLSKIKSRKQRLYTTYRKLLSSYKVPFFEVALLPDVSPLYWFSTFRFERAKDLSHYLSDAGIQTRWLFYPLHLQPSLDKHPMVRAPACYDASVKAYADYLSLPSSACLSIRNVAKICKTIYQFYKGC